MTDSSEQQYPHPCTLLNQEEPLTEAQQKSLREGFEDGLNSASMGHSPKTEIGVEVRKHIWMLMLVPPGMEGHPQIHTYWGLISEFRQRVDNALATRRNIGYIPHADMDPDSYAY